MKGSAGACCCGSRDGVGCRSGHLELLSWIYCVKGGQGQAPPPQHENFVSIGHRADTGSADKSPSRSLDENPVRARGRVLSGVSLWHDLNTD